MKKLYCKFCGLELENGTCKCDRFLSARKSESETKNLIKCDTCGKKIDEDSVFCPYCGVNQKIDGNIKELQSELKGEKAIDVLKFYQAVDKANGIKKSKVKSSPARFLVTAILLLAIFSYAFFEYLYPFIKERIREYQLRQQLLNNSTTEYSANNYQTTSHYVSSESMGETIAEPEQPTIELKDTWVRRDGFIYSFDKNGDPVVDDWVTETDEKGVEQKYYFDIDGKLVVNSWIDGEYYVGSNGAMLKKTFTPDGAKLGEDGKVIVKEAVNTLAQNETHVYYEAPNLVAETVSASQQKSSSSGEIKGVKADKVYELYVKNIIQMRETVTRGDLKCNIIYYLPVIDGVDPREVELINNGMVQAFAAFKNQLVAMANGASELPKSIIFNTVEQRSLTSNRMNILVHGRLLPRNGLYDKKKFRFIYDRKARTVVASDISSN